MKSTDPNGCAPAWLLSLLALARRVRPARYVQPPGWRSERPTPPQADERPDLYGLPPDFFERLDAGEREA